MTTQDIATPATVAEHATEQARLPRTALLGIFGPAKAPRALIRLRHGDTRSVSVGDRIAGGSVIAIAQGQLVLSRMGGVQVLRMPQG